MKLSNVYAFDELYTANLYVDAVYRGGVIGNIKDDPIHRLMKVGNMGGFRSRKTNQNNYAYIVIYSDNTDPDWPDSLDLVNGIMIYYGDNKQSGRSPEKTPGNRILAQAFKDAHGSQLERAKVPPFFLFTKGVTGRDVAFRGLAVPGANFASQTEDLVGVWKIKDNKRFQNYRAMFTILNENRIKRGWLEDLIHDNPLSENCPPSWRKWIEGRKYTPLKASTVRKYRTKKEQLPSSTQEISLFNIVWEYFNGYHFLFEEFACEIVKFLDKNIINVNLTQPYKDGGRDGIGEYRIGTHGDGIDIEFAMQAKCNSQTNSVGVGDISRLISRLRHRQFGILVTTSYVAQQAYKEIKEDQHPIIILAGKDLAQILMSNGYGNVDDLLSWLKTTFPKSE